MEGFLILLTLAAVILFIFLFTRMMSLENRVRDLEWELRNVQRRIPQPAPEVDSNTRPRAPQPSPAPPSVAVPSASPSPPVSVPPPVPYTPPPVPPLRVRPPEPPKAPSRTRGEFEAFVGGKLLNRIGALALVIGVGFFLKYAFDNNWITESMRVVIGFAAGIGVLFTGVRTHKKGLQIFAQGLFGAGIAILYVSSYASFNFYHLVSQLVAFGMMGVVTIVAFRFAFMYDSLAISLLALIGGFLTPFLLSTGHANEAGLFTYIALLELGLIAVVFMKPSWIILEPLTLAGTYVIFWAWYDQYYADDTLALTLFFLSLFWVILFASDVYRTMRSVSTQQNIRQLTGFLNVVGFYSSLYAIINRLHHPWMGFTTLVVCILYLLNVILMIRKSPESKDLIVQQVLTTILLLVIATSIQYTGFTTVIFWSIEAASLVWCSVRWNLRYVYAAALGLFLVSFVKLASTSGAFEYAPIEQFRLIFNYRALSFATIAVAMGVSGYLIKGLGYSEISTIRGTLDVAWCAILLGLIAVETSDFFRQQYAGTTPQEIEGLEFKKMMTLLCAWIIYSIPLVYGGMKTGNLAIAVPGFVVVAVVLLLAVFKGISFSPIEFYKPLLNVRAFAVIMVLAGTYYHISVLKQYQVQYSWATEIYGILLVASVLLFLWLLTGETRDIFESQIYATRRLFAGEKGVELTRIENLKQMSLSSLWLIYGIILMVAGIWRRVYGLRILSIILFGISILKIFIYDLSFLQTLYRIFSFIGLGLILLAASYMYQRYKSVIFGDGDSGNTSVENMNWIQSDNLEDR